ncbi:hypothetical protein MMC12_006779 [Toensbergia leucococca]|nr:hypothetical protein [Toensbergia leucococca]
MDRARPRRPLKTQYLILYNLISAILWLAILGRVILLVPLVGFSNVYGGVGGFAKWTQTLAVLEVVHSALGLVRSPILTTLMQVASRFWLIWGIVNTYPQATASSPFYSSMLVAWSFTEVVRYSYFVLNLRGAVPGFVTWLRYNTFFVLYPTGIASEMWLQWKASQVADKNIQLAIWAMLLIYVPGSYILYSHMITQRRKVIRGKQPERRDRALTR